MVEIDVAAVLPGDGETGLTGITDLAVLSDPAGDILYAVTREGTLTAWGITGDGLAPLAIESLPVAPVAGLEAGLVVVEAADGAASVLVTGAGGLWVSGAGAEGLSDVAAVTAGAGGLPADLAFVAEVAAGGVRYLAGVCQGSERPGLWRLEADGSLTQVSAPGAGQQAAGITALAGGETGGASFLLGAAAGSQALVVWQVGPGGLTETGRIGAADGIGIATPSALAVVEAHGLTYAILGAAGSSSLTVAAIGPDGAPVLSDHILDTLDTRFQGVTALEVATFGGRSYVVAAGADDGLSLFEILPGGRLLHLATLADGFDTTLANVSDLALGVTGAGLQVTVASAAEPGLTLLNVALPQGAVLSASGAGDTVSGGAGDDLLAGGMGDDSLAGGAGDDVILDGTGEDTLRGGAGGDIFVLEADGRLDVIVDFDPAEDQLDLSAWAFLRDSGQLVVIERSDGVEIWYGEEQLILYSADGGSITVEEIAGLDLLSVDRLLPEWGEELAETPAPREPDLVIAGTEQADSIVTAGGHDSVSGQGGDDTLSGGGGHDWIEGVANYDEIHGGAGNDTLSGDDGNDTLYGDAGDDLLIGGTQNDELHGGDGDDLLEGRANFDLMYGGGGSDTLYGGDGHDTLQGGAGNDHLIGGPGGDQIHGDNGNDLIEGGDNNDLVAGGAGQDSLYGGAGNDTLDGGAGNDLLHGGPGADVFVFTEGTDTIADFDPAADRVVLEGAAGALTAAAVDAALAAAVVQDGGTVVLDFGASGTLILSDLSDPAAALDPGLFGF